MTTVSAVSAATLQNVADVLAENLIAERERDREAERVET